LTPLLFLLLPLACKDPEIAAVQARTSSYETKLAEGRTLMAANQPARAAKAFRSAVNTAPENPEPLLLMAEALRAAGDEAQAILVLKEAEALVPGADPALQKQIAELYRRQGQVEQAIATLVVLRDADQLTDLELLALARMQARIGDTDGAFKSLEPIQRERPDDPDAKVVETEILLIKGEELLAAKLMDRLVEENPGLIEARLLRVRYFLNSGYAAEALADLGGITGKDANLPEVVMLRARILTKLERHKEVETELTRFTEEHPDNVEGLTVLAETKLMLENPAEAQQLVDKALKLRALYPRALYVRARALELQGDKRGAEEHYGYALTADPRFAPALSRVWRMQQEAGLKSEATQTLERLYRIGEASVEEKVTLASMYADSRTNLDMGRKLIDEALQREPGNPKYVAIKAALTRAAPKKKSGGSSGGGIIIMRGKR
jgi:tetratricopeptide (TPR) repeat protein